MENNKYTDALQDTRKGIENSNDLGWRGAKDKISNFINQKVDKFRSNQDHIDYAPGESPTDFAHQNISDYQKQYPNFDKSISYTDKPSQLMVGDKEMTLTPNLSMNSVKTLPYTDGNSKIFTPNNPSTFERMANANYDILEHPSTSSLRDAIYKAHETYEAGSVKDQFEILPKNELGLVKNFDAMNMNFDDKEISSHLGMGVLAREASLLNGLLQKYPNDPNVIKAVEKLYSYRNKDGEYDILSGAAQKDIGDINSTSLPGILEKIKTREASPLGNKYNYDDEALFGPHPVKSPVFDMDPEKYFDARLENMSNNNPVGFFKDAGNAVSNMFENSTLEKIDHLLSGLE